MLDRDGPGRHDAAVPQPVLKRVKTSHAIVEYVQREIFEGRLRPGDRIDVDGISATLGVSPTPVREAIVMLEREGLVSSQVHRSAFVEHFDARTLRADFQVLGLMRGVAAARVAKDRDPEVLDELGQLLRELRAVPADEPARVGELVADILRVERRAGATPRLRAELAGFSDFLDWATRISDRRGRDEIAAAQAAVFDAITAGDSRRASQARVADARAAAEEVIRELVRRDVLPDDAEARARS
jgi:DNA-binding GntR family transcriptional regulator